MYWKKRLRWCPNIRGICQTCSCKWGECERVERLPCCGGTGWGIHPIEKARGGRQGPCQQCREQGDSQSLSVHKSSWALLSSRLPFHIVPLGQHEWTDYGESFSFGSQQAPNTLACSAFLQARGLVQVTDTCRNLRASVASSLSGEVWPWGAPTRHKKLGAQVWVQYTGHGGKGPAPESWGQETWVQSKYGFQFKFPHSLAVCPQTRTSESLSSSIKEGSW